MKVLLLSRFDRLGASSRVRSYQYLHFLKRGGIDVTVAPLLEDDYLSNFYSGKINHMRFRLVAYLRRLAQLLKSHQFDLLWIECELFPWLPAWGEVLLARFGIRYIVDYGDASFHRYDVHPNGVIRRLLGNKIDIIMRYSAQVVVGNDYLAVRARHAGAKCVEYVPTVVDLERYRTKQQGGDTSFTIGWIGTPITVRHLDLVRPVLSEFCKGNNSNIVIVGGGSFNLDGVQVMTLPWSEDAEVSQIQNFDVGIMPLADEPWEQGKCGYKLIQYMACGKPVVASPVGVNSKIVDHGTNGFLARSKEEWLEALTTLRDNTELRKKLGEAGRKKVEKVYSLQVTAPRLLAILKSVAKGKN